VNEQRKCGAAMVVKIGACVRSAARRGSAQNGVQQMSGAQNIPEPYTLCLSQTRGEMQKMRRA